MSQAEPIRLAFACPGCGQPVETVLEAGLEARACPRCGHLTPLPEARETPTGSLPPACPVCGCPDRYGQRDFNRKLGLALAGLGLALGPFTRWISTVAAIALDALLYLRVPQVGVCYACNAQTRGLRAVESPAPFEIAIHDAYKFGKRFPPRRAAAVAGPFALRLLWEGKAKPPAAGR